MTKIEWTDKTWNPIRARNKATGGTGHYCVKVSDGCRNCYAETFQPRFKNPIRYAAQDRAMVDIFLDEKTLLAPLRWKKPRMVFVCSMTDLFAEWVPDDWIDQVFAVMALTPQHTYQVLTKRPERMRDYLVNDATYWRISCAQSRGGMGFAPGQINHENDAFQPWNRPLRNVWAMTSVEDQPSANARIPQLLATPAAVRGISLEPMLGPVDLTNIDTMAIKGCERINALTGEGMDFLGTPVRTIPNRIHWVIVGGESGPGARPIFPDWAHDIRDQCSAAGVAFFFKQWGDYLPAGERRADGQLWKPLCGSYLRATKSMTGRLLDGREYNQLPITSSPQKETA
jgi:protein gp37